MNEPVLIDEQLPDTRPRLTTERLILRPFQMDDAESVFRICSVREIALMTRTIPHPYPPTRASEWIAQHAGLWLTGQSAIFAIMELQREELVGAIGLEIDEENQNAELGYWIAKGQWGRGYCSEAAAQVLRFGFENLSLHRIHAHHMNVNPASGRVLQKIGMSYEGRMRGHVRKWGSFYDVLCYGILKTDIESRQVRNE